MSKSNKKNALSLATKMELLEAVSKNELSKTEICYKFNVPKSTLSTIIKQKKKIEEAYERSRFEPERKRLRTAKYCSVEEATHQCIAFFIIKYFWLLRLHKPIAVRPRLNYKQCTHACIGRGINIHMFIAC